MHIGCDIVKNERLKNKNNRFIEFVLTEKEKKEYIQRGLMYLCGCFAAKEAIMKALPNTKDLNFLDIEILTDNNGFLYCANISNIKISISYETEYTIAYVIIEN